VDPSDVKRWAEDGAPPEDASASLEPGGAPGVERQPEAPRDRAMPTPSRVGGKTPMKFGKARAGKGGGVRPNGFARGPGKSGKGSGRARSWAKAKGKKVAS
jgi:hypothetical protein